VHALQLESRSLCLSNKVTVTRAEGHAPWREERTRGLGFRPKPCVYSKPWREHQRGGAAEENGKDEKRDVRVGRERGYACDDERNERSVCALGGGLAESRDMVTNGWLQKLLALYFWGMYAQKHSHKQWLTLTFTQAHQQTPTHTHTRSHFAGVPPEEGKEGCSISLKDCNARRLHKHYYQEKVHFLCIFCLFSWVEAPSFNIYGDTLLSNPVHHLTRWPHEYIEDDTRWMIQMIQDKWYKWYKTDDTNDTQMIHVLSVHDGWYNPRLSIHVILSLQY